jgi:hypothetical protein
MSEQQNYLLFKETAINFWYDCCPLAQNQDFLWCYYLLEDWYSVVAFVSVSTGFSRLLVAGSSPKSKSTGCSNVLIFWISPCLFTLVTCHLMPPRLI